MKDLAKKIQGNFIFFIEIIIYAVMLGVNIFFAFEIYEKVIENVSASGKVADLEITGLNSLDGDLLKVFEEDHQKRTSYLKDYDFEHNNEWDSLEKPISPF